MYAVLHDAIDCYQRYALARDERKQAMFADARAWIETTNERDWPLSFENICETLGLDAESIRGELARRHNSRASLKRRAPRIVPLAGRRLSVTESVPRERQETGCSAPPGVISGCREAAEPIGAHTAAVRERTQRSPSAA